MFLTIDQGIEHEQNWQTLDFAILVVHVPRNEIDFYRPLVPAIQAAIASARPGQLIHVGM